MIPFGSRGGTGGMKGGNGGGVNGRGATNGWGLFGLVREGGALDVLVVELRLSSAVVWTCMRHGNLMTQCNFC